MRLTLAKKLCYRSHSKTLIAVISNTNMILAVASGLQ